MKFHRTFAAAALGLCLLIAPAKADTITTFDLSATVLCGPCTLGGDIVINTTSGQVVSANVTFATNTVPNDTIALNLVNVVPFEMGTVITIVDPLDVSNNLRAFTRF